MKKKIRILFALIVCVLMVHTGITATAIPVSAAVKTNGTIDLQKKALIIPNGKKTAIKQNKITIVRGCKYQVKAKSIKAKLKSSKPSVLSVSKKIITAKKPGTATLRITYKNKNQSLKIRIVASHKHSFKVTKKATCKAKGVQTCSVCGVTESIDKTAHEYKTETSEYIEGRGKPYEVSSTYCNGCGADMTNWTQSEIDAHRTNFDNWDCFGAAIYGTVGETRYPKYVMTKTVAIYCKHCGAWKSQTTTDLYECDPYGNKIETGSDVATSTKATVKAVADAQDVIADSEEINTDVDNNVVVSNNETTSENIVSDNEIVSENTIIID